MKKICVFCGSSSGTEKSFENATVNLGKSLADRDIELVYGGARIGLMGAIADSLLKEGGKVTGVLPTFLQEKNLAHPNLTHLIVVNSMHERKIKMHELSDGVIALPGGFETLEELFEILTWGQLNLHQKPVGILNINGFFDALVEFVQNMVNQGFLKEVNKNMLLISDNADDLLELMQNYKAITVKKWIEK